MEKKFRYWDDRKKEYYHNPCCCAVGEDGVVIVDPDNNTWENTNFKAEQSLGKKDKNEKELFEGDIVAFDDGEGWVVGKGVITFKDFFAIEYDGELFSPLDSPMKIIGNINESPELLEGQP